MQYSMNWSGMLRGASVAVPTIGAFALLGLVGSYWTWQWFAPKPEARSPVQSDAGGQASGALELFGSSQEGAGIPVSTATAMRLLGVVAAKEGKAAYALVIMDDKQIVAARIGDEIGPGITLAEVAPNQIVLDRNGVRESLAWPEKGSPLESPGQGAIR